MKLEFDAETIRLIEDWEAMNGDTSYALHLADRILELYKKATQ